MVQLLQCACRQSLLAIMSAVCLLAGCNSTDGTDQRDRVTVDDNGQEGQLSDSDGAAVDNDEGSDEGGAEVDLGPPLVEEAACYSGTFDCLAGPDPVPCGSWQFVINETNAIVGSGAITDGFGPEQIDVELSGLFDPDASSLAFDLAGPEGGSGVATVTVDGPAPLISGVWTYTNGVDPTATTVEGGMAGRPCVPEE